MYDSSLNMAPLCSQSLFKDFVTCKCHLLILHADKLAYLKINYNKQNYT